MKIKHLVSSVIKGYSLLRAYENDYVRNIRLNGVGIDLGAKSKDAKYYEYFCMNDVERIDFVDFYSAGKDVIKLNLEVPFPIESGNYDFVLLFNVMEHIFDYKNLLDETVRILKPGGVLHGFVPFMWHFHPDPNDYFRFTEQALQRLIEREGVEQVKIVPICYGPFKVAATVLGGVIKFKVIKIVTYSMAMFLDSILMRVSSGATRYPMGYYFSATRL